MKPSRLNVRISLKVCSFLMVLTLVALSCSKEDDTPPPVDNNGELVTSNGVNADDFERYKGALGMIVSARNVAKKGYKPVTANLTIQGSQGDYSQTIEIDPFSFMGKVQLEIEGLSDAAKEELVNGIPVTVDYKDATGATIFSNTISAVTFSSNPPPTSVNVAALADTPDSEDVFFGDLDYVLQRVDQEGNLTNLVFRVQEISGDDVIVLSGVEDFNMSNTNDEFRIDIISSNASETIVAFKHKSTGRYIEFGTTPSFPSSIVSSSIPLVLGATSIPSASAEDYHFKIQKYQDGVYRLRSIGFNDFVGFTGQDVVGLNLIESDLYIRPIATNANWSIENISASFVAPILPEPQTSFGANSTLTNCTSAGTLSQTIGFSLTEEYSNTIGWSESLSITTTNTVNVEVSATVGFEASFFGTGGNASATVSAGYQYSRAATESSSNFGEGTATVSETIFQERTVTVPPQSASLVYDVAQYYPNTKVQMAQRLRVRATNSSGVALSGELIRALFRYSRFNGVVTQVGSDFIEVSLQGTMTLERILETQSSVQEVEPNCN
ncbi:hypothetical protein ACPX19_12355 [Winogradskyella sp. HB-48]|uniref:hypothetical protein n=1 Tax=Winogradskyella sp. HB-48 TaxID=3416808 RepID=UPI003CEEB4A5